MTELENAVEAARRVAAWHGLHVDEPVPLAAANNTILHLVPYALVVKIDSGQKRGVFHREIDIVNWLAERGAPIVTPSPLVPAIVHHFGTLDLTFWEYTEPSPSDPPHYSAGEALNQLHEIFASYPNELPQWTDEIDQVAKLLEAGIPTADERDLSTLQTGLTQLRPHLDALTLTMQPIHGEPHDRNRIYTNEGWRFLDFESACLGPRELDACYLTNEELSDDGLLDMHVREVLRVFVSVRVATWCWAGIARADDSARHARWHTDRVAHWLHET